jgi:trans-aconitate 2-methyltransferase
VTETLLERAAEVVAVDAAPSMVEAARARLGDRAEVLQAELTEFELAKPVDAVFSNAVFHWIEDHDALFRALHAALRPGGRLVAQCGGKGNIDRVRRTAADAASAPPYAKHLAGFDAPWNYASPEETTVRLERAGFEQIRCWLEPWPVVPGHPESYLRSVCLCPYVDRLPAEVAPDYVRDVMERLGDPVELDYIRLNIDARRPA